MFGYINALAIGKFASSKCSGLVIWATKRTAMRFVAPFSLHVHFERVILRASLLECVYLEDRTTYTLYVQYAYVRFVCGVE